MVGKRHESVLCTHPAGNVYIFHGMQFALCVSEYVHRTEFKLGIVLLTSATSKQF